jgi:hypothetical protein
VAVFCVAVPCSLVKVHRLFRRTCIVHHEGPVPLHPSTSETSVYFNRTAVGARVRYSSVQMEEMEEQMEEGEATGPIKRPLHVTVTVTARAVRRARDLPSVKCVPVWLH